MLSLCLEVAVAKLRYPRTERDWIRAILDLQLDELHLSAVAAIIWWDQLGSMPAGQATGRQLKAIADARIITDVDQTIICEALINLGYDQLTAQRRTSLAKRDAGTRPPRRRKRTKTDEAVQRKIDIAKTATRLYAGMLDNVLEEGLVKTLIMSRLGQLEKRVSHAIQHGSNHERQGDDDYDVDSGGIAA